MKKINQVPLASIAKALVKINNNDKGDLSLTGNVVISNQNHSRSPMQQRSCAQLGYAEIVLTAQ